MALTRRQAAALTGAAALCVAIGAVVALQRLGVGEAGVVIAVLAAPLLVYLVASGDVSELSGPGGLSAKFRNTAQAPVNAAADIEALQLVGKTSLDELMARATRLRPGVPVALTFRLRGGDAYDRYAMERYLERLLRIDPDLVIAFLDDDGKLVASTDGAGVVSVIANDHLGAQFETAMKAGDLDALRALTALSVATVSRSETNAQALRRMLDDKVKSLVAVDDARRPVGVVRRDDIVAKLMASLSA
jgi:hypothetical protein